MSTIKEVSAFFNVNPRTVRRWIADGHLKAFKRDGTTRISAEDIQEFIKAGK